MYVTRVDDGERVYLYNGDQLLGSVGYSMYNGNVRLSFDLDREVKVKKEKEHELVQAASEFVEEKYTGRTKGIS